MKLCDRFGNELSAGDAVAWTVSGQVLLATVQKCINPDSLFAEGGKNVSGKIVISIELAIASDLRPDSEGRVPLEALIKSWNPESQKVLKSAMA
jgi:hypothetical protein